MHIDKYNGNVIYYKYVKIYSRVKPTEGEKMKKISLVLAMLFALLGAFMLTACGGDGETSSQSPDTTYTIQYTDSTGNHSITVKNGDVYSLESIPEKFGYEFLGLFDLESGGTQYVSATGNSLSPFTDNKNMTLFPQFKNKEYTVVLDYQGAEVSGNREISVSYDSKLMSLPMNLKLENKNFVGWFTEPNAKGTQIADQYGVLPLYSKVNEKNFDLSNEDGYICLYAGFKYQEYTLTLYIGSNSTPEEIKVEWGTPISAVVPETRVDGKAVLSWSKTKNDTTLSNLFDGKVEGDMILYSAELAPVIDFNSKGGKDVEPIVSRAGDTVTLPTPKRDNYTFIGWFDAGNNKYEATTMPENSITLSAKWQANIVLNENGGTDVADISKPVGEAIELPTPSREDYIFAGWYQGNEKYTSTSMPENSIELTAKWYAIKKESITLINATTVEDRVNQSPTFPNDTDYDKVKYVQVIDLSKICDKNTDSIKITAHYKAKPEYNTTSKISLDFSYYSKPIASDAYLMWQTQDVFTNYSEEYTSFTKETELKLTSDIIYVCIWHQYAYKKGDYIYATDLTDFWVEIEYPDMTTLY